jgi:hypothetical protein
MTDPLQATDGVNRITAMWQATTWPGLEHCHVRASDKGIWVDGMVVALDGAPIRLRYRIRCDPVWTVRRLDVAEMESGTELTFVSDGAGRWTDGAGQPLAAFDGCVDVDLAATPFTNTLPIRRLGLRPGEARDLRMLYVLVPEMTVRAAEQRYTCLEQGEAGGLYRYESGSFRVDLPVDADGLVLDYPGYWRRLWP